MKEDKNKKVEKLDNEELDKVSGGVIYGPSIPVPPGNAKPEGDDQSQGVSWPLLIGDPQN